MITDKKRELWPAIREELHRRIARWAGLVPLPADAEEQQRRIYRQKLIHKVSHRIAWQFLFAMPLLIFVFWLGNVLGPGRQDSISGDGKDNPQPAGEKKIQFWTCSMHPQIRLPNNDAKCPICFMDLVAVYSSTDDVGAEGSLALSEGAKKLARVETAAVEYRRLTHSLHLVGKVAYDETRVANINLWTPGRSRLNRMFVAFTGATVKKDEPLVEVYSPDLITAQGEYLAAYERRKKATESSESSVGQVLTDNLAASHRKLLDLGITKGQVSKLEKRGKPEQTTLVYSPVGGTILDKLVNEGEWHGRGMSIYRIADLSQVWVKLDAYESDLFWIRYAQEISLETEAYPGEVFRGRIAFVDPFLDEKTRTVKLRVNVANPHGKLRPGMFVRASLHARLAEGGKVIDETLAGKWLCPVHPEIIADEKGVCPQPLGIGTEVSCRRPLVRAEELQFAGENPLRTRVLSIPHSAPLLTGKRAIVYVEQKSGENLHYHAVEVTLGPRAGDYYAVLSGLEEGQRVVSQGSFKIDSALQILAKPSMMNPPQKPLVAAEQVVEEISPYAIANASYHLQMRTIVDVYLDMGENLAADDIDKAARSLATSRQIVETISLRADDLPTVVYNKLQEHLRRLQKFTTAVGGENEAKYLREQLSQFTTLITAYLDDFGHRYEYPLYLMHCPMARSDKGDFWWQRTDKLANPYFGTQMLRCGEKKRVLAPLKGKQRGKIATMSGRHWHRTAPYHQPIRELLKAYLAIGEVMARDSVVGVERYRQVMLRQLATIDLEKMVTDEHARKSMDKQLAFLRQLLQEMHGEDLAQLRRDYLDISAVLIRYLKSFGHIYPGDLYLLHCPMYRHDLGGSWIQDHNRVTNPFFGKEMLHCGEIGGKIPSLGEFDEEKK